MREYRYPERSLEFFLGNCVKVGECLEWQRSFDGDGYPRIPIKHQLNGRCHREVFFLCNGYYPDVVRHTCDNTKCLNPEHLLPGNNLDNIKDRHSRKRTGNYVSKEEYDLVHDLKDKGLLWKDIADQLGIKFRRVEYILTLKNSEF